jgi:hypothetical protein
MCVSGVPVRSLKLIAITDHGRTYMAAIAYIVCFTQLQALRVSLMQILKQTPDITDRYAAGI